MATIHNTIDKVAGDPQSDAEVTVEIVWDKSQGVVPKEVSTETTIVGPFKTDTDEDGYWSVNLVANTEILPIHNAYKVTEVVGSQSVTYYVYVSESATPNYWSHSVIIAKPGWV